MIMCLRQLDAYDNMAIFFFFFSDLLSLSYELMRSSTGGITNGKRQRLGCDEVNPTMQRQIVYMVEKLVFRISRIYLKTKEKVFALSREREHSLIHGW